MAYQLASWVLPDYACQFSRHDFTVPQLFACLVVREHQRKSYRGIEALLRDSEHWCKDIGLRRVPDHNTLCRAFHHLVHQHHIGRLLDIVAQWMVSGETLAIDSTLLDVRYHSRYYGGG